MKRAARALVVSALVLAMAWVVFKVVDLAAEQRDTATQTSQSVAGLRSENAELRRDVTTSDTARLALEAQVKALGQTPVVSVPESSGPSVRYIPIPGPQGPSIPYTELIAAVRSVVSASLLESCGADGCRDGAKGDPGTNGINGTTSPPGKDGKDGADSTVPGPPGAPGADGRGIISAFCGDEGRWTLTYTDGTTADAGECRTSLIPPATDPTPTE